eukprot:165130-Rhodomonas_salina.1
MGAAVNRGLFASAAINGGTASRNGSVCTRFWQRCLRKYQRCCRKREQRRYTWERWGHKREQ